MPWAKTNVIAKNIKQDVIRIEQDQKYQELVVQLHERQGSVIVFIKTKYGADRMATNLRKDGFTADALHGDLRQHKRDKVMRNFREQKFRVLIATDIAARGLDVPHIEHVVNYDLPQVAEDYIHRMGRTARAGAEGSAVSFVSNQDGRKWHAIQILLNPDAVRKPANDKFVKRRAAPARNRKASGKPDARKNDDRKFDDRKPNAFKPDTRKQEPRNQSSPTVPRKPQERRAKSQEWGQKAAPRNSKPHDRKRVFRGKKRAA
ncbi:MAG: C-terminal helicase domain-containing protein [Alphaproteobacteria bacterium]|nr:C-terminal helicase domain-containing protein [Alphaproteobacteria bacterium]